MTYIFSYCHLLINWWLAGKVNTYQQLVVMRNTWLIMLSIRRLHPKFVKLTATSYAHMG